jgi:hypothetical protein
VPKLLEQVRDLIRVKHYSLRTEAAFLRWIKERRVGSILIGSVKPEQGPRILLVREELRGLTTAVRAEHRRVNLGSGRRSNIPLKMARASS